MRTKSILCAMIFTAITAASPVVAADLSCPPGPGCGGPPVGVIVQPPTFGPPVYVADQGPTLSGPGITVYGSVWTGDDRLPHYPFVFSRGGYVAGAYR